MDNGVVSDDKAKEVKVDEVARDTNVDNEAASGHTGDEVKPDGGKPYGEVEPDAEKPEGSPSATDKAWVVFLKKASVYILAFLSLQAPQRRRRLQHKTSCIFKDDETEDRVECVWEGGSQELWKLIGLFVDH